MNKKPYHFHYRLEEQSGQSGISQSEVRKLTLNLSAPDEVTRQYSANSRDELTLLMQAEESRENKEMWALYWMKKRLSEMIANGDPITIGKAGEYGAVTDVDGTTEATLRAELCNIDPNLEQYFDKYFLGIVKNIHYNFAYRGEHAEEFTPMEMTFDGATDPRLNEGEANLDVTVFTTRKKRQVHIVVNNCQQKAVNHLQERLESAGNQLEETADDELEETATDQLVIQEFLYGALLADPLDEIGSDTDTDIVLDIDLHADWSLEGEVADKTWKLIDGQKASLANKRTELEGSFEPRDALLIRIVDDIERFGSFKSPIDFIEYGDHIDSEIRIETCKQAAEYLDELCTQGILSEHVESEDGDDSFVLDGDDSATLTVDNTTDRRLEDEIPLLRWKLVEAKKRPTG